MQPAKVQHVAAYQFMSINGQDEPQWLTASGNLLRARHRSKTSSNITPRKSHSSIYEVSIINGSILQERTLRHNESK